MGYFCFTDASLTLLDEKYTENELSLDVNFVGDHLVYKSILVRQLEGCKMACYFEHSDCKFFFTQDPPNREAEKTYGSYLKNCYLGSFSKKRVASRRFGYKPYDYNFTSSSFVNLTTKGKINVTETLIATFGLNSNKSVDHGECQGSGKHFITRNDWILPFDLVQTAKEVCIFTLFRLVEGTVKLSIPTYAVRLHHSISCWLRSLL